MLLDYIFSYIIQIEAYLYTVNIEKITLAMQMKKIKFFFLFNWREWIFLQFILKYLNFIYIFGIWMIRMQKFKQHIFAICSMYIARYLNYFLTCIYWASLRSYLYGGTNYFQLFSYPDIKYEIVKIKQKNIENVLIVQLIPKTGFLKV